jgi:GTP cyclohydrolase I
MAKEVSKTGEAPQACNSNRAIPRPSRAEAEKAVEILLRWAGEDPSREGLLETPAPRRPRVRRIFRRLRHGPFR